MGPGKFITLEGIDGAGKSTHLPWLAECLRPHVSEVIATREPGGTPLGEALRPLLLTYPMLPETEAMLMFAARAEHLHQVIVPALKRGAWVISDRFTDASFAYQCGGKGVPDQWIEALEQWIQRGLKPDCTLLFDVPTATAQARLRQSGQSADRFEKESNEFFSRVRQTYLQRAADSAGRMRIIDGTQSIAAIRLQLDAVINGLLEA